jgi:glycosyltransferase involved in cell wall biosynthesis
MARALKARRVLFVSTPAYIGGAEVSLLALMEHLDATRYQPALVTGGPGPLLDEARAAGIPCAVQEFAWSSRRRPWRYPASVVSLGQRIRRGRFDVIHTNCDRSLRSVMWASLLSRTPYVSHVRDFSRTWFEARNVSALNRAARVVANSEATMRACIDAGVKQRLIVTLYNPIDLRAFKGVPAEARGQVRAELGIPSDALVVGFVGQIQRIKGCIEFVSAACEVAGQGPNTHYLLVGAAPPGDEAARFALELEQQVRASAWPERFHFAGYRADIPRVMRAIDILAVPSWNEPFGRVAVEGMAARCAVVGTNAGGLPEIVTDGRDGLLVPPNDVVALATAFARLRADQELRRRLANEGERSAERFSIEQHVDAAQGLYDRVLSDPRVA